MMIESNIWRCCGAKTLCYRENLLGEATFKWHKWIQLRQFLWLEVHTIVLMFCNFVIRNVFKIIIWCLDANNNVFIKKIYSSGWFIHLLCLHLEFKLIKYALYPCMVGMESEKLRKLGVVISFFSPLPRDWG